LRHCLQWTTALLALIQVGGHKVDTLVQAEFLNHLLFVYEETKSSTKTLEFYKGFREQLAHAVANIMTCDNCPKAVAIIKVLRMGSETLTNRLLTSTRYDQKDQYNKGGSRPQTFQTSGPKRKFTNNETCRYPSLSKCWYFQNRGHCDKKHTADLLTQGLPQGLPLSLFVNPNKTVGNQSQNKSQKPKASDDIQTSKPEA
jgi:hypothetical protein